MKNWIRVSHRGSNYRGIADKVDKALADTSKLRLVGHGVPVSLQPVERATEQYIVPPDGRRIKKHASWGGHYYETLEEALDVIYQAITKAKQQEELAILRQEATRMYDCLRYGDPEHCQHLHKEINAAIELNHSHYDGWREAITRYLTQEPHDDG